MENQLVQLTETEFDEKFELIDNHLDNNASFDGKMFETYSPEIDFVLEMAKQNRVITIIEGEDEIGEDGEPRPSMYYSSGYHLFNRIGYLITIQPITHDFEVKLI